MNQSVKGTYERISPTRYRLRYPIGTLSNGNPNRLSKNIEATNDQDALLALVKWNLHIEEKGYTHLDRITFETFYHDFWKKEAQINLEIRGYEGYLSILDQRFLKPLGSKRLREIKPYEIKNIIVNATSLKSTNAELSRKTKKKYLNAISNVFTVARDEYQIVDTNPCKDVLIPKEKVTKRKKSAISYYSESEIQHLFETLQTAPLRTQAIIMTAFITGAREGEICALEEKHINFDTNEILFEQRIILSKDKGLLRIDGLKADDYKVLSVPEDYLEIMRDFIDINVSARRKLEIDDPKHCYIFGTVDGKPVTPASLYKHWIRYAQKNGLRQIRFHDWRHTSATQMIANNIPLKNVQERLGHKDYTTTVNIYAHATKEIDKEASNLFGSFIKKH